MIEQAVRNGQWLVLDWPLAPVGTAAAADREMPKAGSHPHEMRQWLLASSIFPEKWINRLFSVGGIRWQGDRLELLAFPAADPLKDPLYRLAADKRPDGGADAAVLFEDDYCIVMNKPAGMPVHASHPGQRGTLDEAVARHMLGRNDPLPVRHIHRLDDDTSGPVLYSKNDLAQWKLDEAMRAKEIDRRYVAVVHGRPFAAEGTIDKPIGKDRHHPQRRRVSLSGDRAITHYKVAASDGRQSIVEIRLETGRTHQIRVHMSDMGHPLLGDTLYGGKSALPHQALHGERLIFRHPLTGLVLDAAAPWPDWLEKVAAQIRSR